MKQIILTFAIALTGISLVNAQGTEAMNNSQNPYKYSGIALYTSLNHLIDSITTEIENGAVFDGTHIWRNMVPNITLTMDEQAFIETYFENIELSLENLIEFENHLLEHNSNNEYSRLLQFASYAIWSKYFSDELNARAAGGATANNPFEVCLDYCIKRRLSGNNLVDWIGFIINPPAGLAWVVAACTWECLGGK